MTLETQMTLVLLQQLLMALKAIDVLSCKCRLALVIDELGREVAAEIESQWRWCLCWLKRTGKS